MTCEHLEEMSEHVKIQDVKETYFPSLILGQVIILVTHRGEKALTELSSAIAMGTHKL